MGALTGSHQRQVLCVVTAHPAGGRDGLRVAVHAAGFGGCVVKIMCVVYNIEYVESKLWVVTM